MVRGLPISKVTLIGEKTVAFITKKGDWCIVNRIFGINF